MCGAAEVYEVRTSDSPIDEQSFASAEALTGAPDPAAPGTTQSYAIPAAAKRYVAIRAVDDQGNVGRVAVVDRGPGPPPSDGDGDGVPDATDECPDEAGPPSNDGCPEDPPGPDPTRCSNVISGTGGADRLRGTEGGDRIRGKDGRDRLRGGGGDDCLIGGGGRDSHFGQRGDDTIRARGRARDFISCGPGDDRAFVDRRDRVKGCETVRRSRR